MYLVLATSGRTLTATRVDAAGAVVGELAVENLAAFVAQTQAAQPDTRWVWHDTAAWYPSLLEARVRVNRCFDLRLCHAILRNSVFTRESTLARARAGSWDALAQAGHAAPVDPLRPQHSTLFDFDDDAQAVADGELDVLAEFLRQLDAVATSRETGRLQRLLSAESAGALIAAEMRFAGLPWSAQAHDEILTEMLGPRPSVDGERPAKLQALVDEIRLRLDSPRLAPESPAELLRALSVAGIQATTTRSWELKQLKHPVIAPLLEFKKLQRLMTANGWSWLDSWVVDGRFRPDYVPGGVVTGRWATSGGGALQLPHLIRGAVRADPGWKFVVADASQLEPRILAAMAGDRGMVAAGASGDLYEGIVASGAVDTRAHAKLAMLGAMYGATSGESGRLMPRLARAYPQAIALVEQAARAGERGEVVSTQLGRSSPPGKHAAAYDDSQSPAQRAASQERGRSWGRFTRNFIVQGTAAEWALCWMASIRNRLSQLSDYAWLTDAPHLVFFLHDEVVVHAPAELADSVAEHVTAAAADAGRLIFGDIPVTFPLTTAIVDRYDHAK
ncbi:bifunctional 3'-5' exonuclease/DNA polymerase [Salinibacterium sp. NSLL150]|uniref:bifunctional 3'-5' exonuclease/DNA polymerase n=1 Tax=unclassified Salinibacterium TaxID=2632331 RepID=UPI0018CE182A|nr:MULTISPECIES: bifunctional 3'-5' exonuclease/DNA polymerase [unclassified Salinibacterium]MBH0098966.1 bifunctional 3'-5' exonuclease/DNA polymerase [Salinibacterium sp. NSLL35]MBH0101721.1 bifunctional 3'-5' exonuclease/DNA polymerase [Salinibacterium sp. NSLL150]MBH0104480.1 bifunctional 3'-5' exonuclease/DNA polymerase [Salinibacterium sp. NSLL16]MBH0107241.1 bifunctional 3'-5' exonuclease/DNA polymerase [Salinibacterium sp. NSLL17]